MATPSDIISRALREANIIPAAGGVSSDQNTEALALYNSLILSVLGSQVGFKLESWRVLADDNIRDPMGLALSASELTGWVVPPNVRLLCSLTEATELNLDAAPEDGARFVVSDVLGNFATYNLTLDGNGATIAGAATIVFSTDDELREFFYRADLGDWQEVTTLAIGDTHPFPARFDDYFATKLAIRLDPRYGVTMAAETANRLAEQEADLIEKYRQSRISAPVVAPAEG